MDKCRTCEDDRWTLNCPVKHTQSAQTKASEANKVTDVMATPTNKNESGIGCGTGPKTPAPRDVTGIRISNLSDNAVESDLKNMLNGLGLTNVKKLYLAKEKSTGRCKGFAFVHFKFRADAAKAIQNLNGCEFHHLILNVEWSKPPATK